MSFLLAQVDWVELLRTGGAAGIITILAVLGIVGAARWFKSTMETTLADARKERDSMRVLNEQQANRFLESLKIRDDIQEKGFDEILRELRSGSTRRK